MSIEIRRTGNMMAAEMLAGMQMLAGTEVICTPGDRNQGYQRKQAMEKKSLHAKLHQPQK
jgi:hypothetical protein